MNTRSVTKSWLITGLSIVIMACSPGAGEDASTTVASDAKPAVTAAAQTSEAKKPAATEPVVKPHELLESASDRLNIYAPFTLTADLSHLTANQKRMLPLLIQASKVMDDLFWRQAYGDKQALLASVKEEKTKQFTRINYGPWDRLDADKPFLTGFGEKPLGANFYPADMTKEEFEAADLPNKQGLYSVIERNRSGQLVVRPYHKVYSKELREASELLRKASTLADDPEFAAYLKLRADALVTDNYQPSDLAWMDMKKNKIDVVIGAIENYEDRLFGYRTAYESYVLIKDLAWSDKLSRYASFLPELQRGLPVPDAYKAEVPGSDSDLNAYDVIFYAGHSNAGSKTIAINLPNDEEVQLQKGTRRLQLKNAMRAKFDKILVPIANQLIVPEQREHVTFDAFFANTMFHEVAHGLGIKNTLDGKSKVRVALKELASATEEGKADILGLYMVTRLFEKNEIPDGELNDHYVTFLASIFRSIRFGSSSAHGKANMVRFNFFQQMGAFSRNDEGQYRVDFDKTQAAMNALSEKLLVLQGDGNYEGTKTLLDTQGQVTASLQEDLERLKKAGIPVDIVFDQGVHNLQL